MITLQVEFPKSFELDHFSKVYIKSFYYSWRDVKVFAYENDTYTVDRKKRFQGFTFHLVFLKADYISDRSQFQTTPLSFRRKSSQKLDLSVAARIYRNACRKLGIQPLRRVLGQFGRPRIILKDLCMSGADVRATCKGLTVSNSNVYLNSYIVSSYCVSL